MNYGKGKSVDDILTELYKSEFMTDLVWTITSGNDLKDDLKSEIFLILCEMDAARIRKAYYGHYLHYLCVNIAKKQYHSKTSPFHNIWRKHRAGDNTIPDSLEALTKTNDDLIIKKILWFVDNKLDLVDRELFKMYYKFDRYDRWHGDLRDTTCVKPISSLRKVEKKLAIITIDGSAISIGHDTIRLSLNRSIMRIKHYLKENELLD